ncbi:hypothetical protein [Salinibacter ruber]|uniref:hypothetical protein n=1 Tax=Salinibacter ruber TaxID=146919 RepID=UPI002072E374|nr:hypothetical protein [Salinibacter ruber]
MWEIVKKNVTCRTLMLGASICFAVSYSLDAINIVEYFGSNGIRIKYFLYISFYSEIVWAFLNLFAWLLSTGWYNVIRTLLLVLGVLGILGSNGLVETGARTVISTLRPLWYCGVGLLGLFFLRSHRELQLISQMSGGEDA